jgi:predicted transcriptional regulator
MQKLTKVEEEIMQFIWEYGPCTVSELIKRIPGKKPPHSTISSIVRILERKGFVDHKAYGRTHEYFAIVDRKTYTKRDLGRIISDYFDGSAEKLVSFLMKEKEIGLKELSDLIDEQE